MKRGHGKPYTDSDLERLTPIERDVLRIYYDTDLSWEQVADALHYSVSRIYQLRRSAFERFTVLTTEQMYHKMETYPNGERYHPQSVSDKTLDTVCLIGTPRPRIDRPVCVKRRSRHGV